MSIIKSAGVVHKQMNNNFPAQPETHNVTETAFPCLLFLSSCFLLFSFLGSMFKKVGEQKKVTKTSELAVPAVPKREAAGELQDHVIQGF